MSGKAGHGVAALGHLGDAMNGLMALPNLLALFLLRREVVKNIP